MSSKSEILIVEDEPIIAAMLCSVLDEEGYAVTCMTCGDEAARSIAADGHSFDAVVADVNLNAGVDGFEIAALLRRTQPALAAIFMTGDEPRRLRSRIPENAVIMEKPFRPSAVAEMLDRLLK